MINLFGAYGYDSYKVSNLSEGTVIDAKGASWIQDNDDRDGQGSPYPFRVYEAPGVVLKGGTITGEIDQESAWRDVYDLGNSAGILTKYAPDVVIRDWKISNTWDAIRVGWDSDNFLIEDVWITDARDDAVENDRLLSGTIRDSLFDGVFVGVSIAPSSSTEDSIDGSGETVTLDGVLMRLEERLYDGEMMHGSLFKTHSGSDGELTPDLRIIDSVFAIEDVDHNSYRSMFDAWEHTVESRNNVFLNLSDDPLPDDYPTPPEGWRMLQGQEARDYWEQARAEWITVHDGEAPAAPDADKTSDGNFEEPVDKNVEELADISEEETDMPEETDRSVDDLEPTFKGGSYSGDDDDETIVGNDRDNRIDGRNGDDVLYGGAGDDQIRGNDGVDQLWGGDGADVFFFKRESDSRDSRGVDTIMDFEAADLIDLSRIDADRGRSGDQAFELANDAGILGQLHVEYDEQSDRTVISATVDRDAELELRILLDGDVALSDADFIF